MMTTASIELTTCTTCGELISLSAAEAHGECSECGAVENPTRAALMAILRDDQSHDGRLTTETVDKVKAALAASEAGKGGE